MLAATLRRHLCNRALNQLEQRLLHAFARHIAGDGRVFRLARDLVDFINVDDAALRLLNVVVAFLQQTLNDVLDVLTHVSGFGQGRCIGNGKGHIQQAGQRFRQQRLARSGRANQQDIGLGELNTILRALNRQALVVVVHRN